MKKDKSGKLENETEHFPFMKEENRHPIEEQKKPTKKTNKLKLIPLIVLALLTYYIYQLNDYSNQYTRSVMHIKSEIKSYVRFARNYIKDSMKAPQRKRYDGPDVTKGRIKRDDGKVSLEKSF